MSFSDLLRVGLRGLKKCPKCNQFNGNRAGLCKNKKCEFVFIRGFEKRKTLADVSRLHTGLPGAVFSVKTRDIGPDYRGFVELREVRPSAQVPSGATAGACHVKWCPGFSDDATRDAVPKCRHVQAALNCSSKAVPLPLKSSVLSMLNINPEMKRKISQLITSCSVPLVQRVSRHVMVVRTAISKKHSLGYLHTSFGMLKTKQYQYSCSCYCSAVRLARKKKSMMEKQSSVKATKDELESEEKQNKQTASEKCIHFYMCVVAFASDVKLTEEFNYFISLAMPNLGKSKDINLTEEESFPLISSKDNSVQLSEDNTPPQELSDTVLSPFVTQMIELPNGGAHLIELHAQLQHKEPHGSQDYSDGSTYELNDIVVYKANNSNDIVKTCDVMLANTLDTVSKQNLLKMEPLDIQIMLADSGNLINLSNVTVNDNNSDIDYNLPMITTPSKCNGDENRAHEEQGLWEVQNMNNAEIINIQQVSLDQVNKLGDNIYTISGDDNSLKIISLEQYDPSAVKREASNSNSGCSSDHNFHFSDVLVGNYVQGIPSSEPKANKRKHVRRLNQDSAKAAQSDSDDELISFNKKKDVEAKKKLRIPTGQLLHILESPSSNIPARKVTRRKKIPDNTQLIKNPMLSDTYSIQNIEHSSDKLIYDHVANLGFNNNIEYQADTTEFTSNDTLISSIITLNESRECTEESMLGSNQGTTYYSINNSLTDDLVLDDLLMKKKKKKSKAGEPVDPVPRRESQVNFSFLSWLSSVTENINQTMHYQFNGKPDALVFHIPQIFFEFLQDRISLGNKKRKLPSQTSVFLRKDAVPIGKFTKYTWNIINIFHIKKIFDTPDIPLDIRQFFKQNQNGTYTQIDEPQYTPAKPANTAAQKISPKNPKLAKKTPLNIRPGNLMTFLKVGCTEPNQRTPTPFRIEWIPDILPKSKIGELRLKFEYGHKQSYISSETCKPLSVVYTS